jgi:hypothetical protein
MTLHGRPTVIAAATVVVCAGVTGIAASAPMHHLASGSGDGVSWTIDGNDTVTGGHVGYCVSVTFVPEGPRNSTCANAGPIALPAGVPARFRSRVSYGAIGFFGTSHCPGATIFVGTVVSRAKTMTLALSTGKILHVRTIPPPSGLASQIAFWESQLPCGASVRELTGREASGKTVAHLVVPVIP